MARISAALGLGLAVLAPLRGEADMLRAHGGAPVAAARPAEGSVVHQPVSVATVRSDPRRAGRAAKRLVLKLRPEVDACLSCAVTRGQRLGGLGVGSRLDGLNRRFGVRRARRLLRGDGTEAAADPARRGRALADRFPARARRAPGTARLPDMGRIYVLDVGARGDLGRLARAYAADPAVEYCEPDGVVETLLSPNDPYFSSTGTWGQAFDDLWGVKKIAAPAAWDSTRGAGVIVAVVDTGIDFTHPDLAENVWENTGEIPDNGVDDDGNGFVDDIRGWNFAGDDNQPIDRHFHGTHVAGTVAAVGGNATGVVGVAFEATVMAVQALDRSGSGYASWVAAAIAYAVDNGADVINASLGGSGASQAVADAVAYAHAAGVVVVVAAGNADDDIVGYFPAGDPDAMTVAASTHTDARADFSNFGVRVDVAAPGGGDGPPPVERLDPLYSVLSLYASDATALEKPYLVVGSKYLRLAGTSMATPHVAGAAALVLARHPEYSVEQVRQALRSTADDAGAPGIDLDFGYGRVNAAGAVSAAAPLEAHIHSPRGGTFVEPMISVTGSAAGPGFASYTLEYGSGSTPSSWTTIAGPIATPVEEGVLAEWDVTEVVDGDYVLQLRAERAGETYVDRAPVRIQSVAISAPERFAALRTDAPIEIRGTAAGAGFASYRVEYRRPVQNPDVWLTDGLALAVPGGAARVYDGVLATLDASFLTAGERFDFRVVADNASGSVTRTRGGIVLDPTLRAGWPQPIAPTIDRQYLTVADLDGDNVKEILVGSWDEVIVFEPDGSVRPGWPQSVVNGDLDVMTPGSPIVADVTGDAAPEVITANRVGDVFVWSGDGTLQAGSPWPVFSAFVTSMSAGDVDGDGKDEIFCTGSSSAAYKGDGQRVLSWTQLEATSAQVPVDVLDDARVEIASFLKGYRRRTRGSLTLRGPDGTVIEGWPRRAGGSFFPRVGMADMDGDRVLDLVMLSEPGSPFNSDRFTVRAFTLAGRRIRLARPNRFVPAWHPALSRHNNGLLSYADMDRDGRAEAYLYVTTFDPQLRRSYGSFVPYRNARRLGNDDGPLPVSHEGYVQFRTTNSIAIGDIDGDGAQEFLAGTSGGYPNEIKPSFIPLPRYALAAQRADGSTVPAFPKAVPQFVLEEDDRRVVTITVHTWYDDPRYNTPAIADLDGDGLKEVAWVDPELNEIFVWNVAGTPGPELADWPMYHHDPKHTNVLPVGGQ